MFCSTIIESFECYTHDNWEYLNIQRPYSIIYYAIDGEAYYQIGNKKEQFKKGHLYLFPANTTFSLFENPSNKFYHLYIHAFIYPSVQNLIELDATQDEFLSAILSTTRKFINKEIPQQPNLYMKKLTELLISYFSEIQEQSKEFLHAKIKDYLDAHYLDVFHSNNLPSIFNYSQSKIDKEFKKAYNITPKKYCTDLIFKHSINLLSEGIPATEIALQLDFSSPANFSRFFKNTCGSYPSEYMKHFKGKK